MNCLRPLSVILTLLWILSNNAEAFTVATAAAGNTYDLMVRQLAAACRSDLSEPIVSKPSTGSMDNVDPLLDNEVSAAIVQSDVLSFREQQDNLAGLKPLFVLHSEEVHLLALADSQASKWLSKVTAMSGLGGKRLTHFADLRARKVGAWGGSIVTARFIRVNTEVEFQLEEFNDEATALKALAAGSVDALLSVGGRPQPWIKELDKRYRLLPFADAEIATLKGFYRPAKLSYANLGQTGVPTVATSAIFVVRDYRSPALVTQITRTRDCFRAHLLELQETPGNRAAWKGVAVDTLPLWTQRAPPESTALRPVGSSYKQSSTNRR